MNALVTSLSRKIPLLEAVAAAVRDDDLGAIVWGADSDPGCLGRWFADRFWEMPMLADPTTPDAIADFCEREQIGLLVPTRDGELAALAALHERLATAGTHVSVGEPEAVATCLDKVAFSNHCRAAGIPTAPTTTDLAGLDGDAFVVKGRYGAGARELAVGLGRDEAADHARGLENPVFQPLLGGVEHSVDVYVNRDGRVVEAAPRTRDAVVGGESQVTTTVDAPTLADAATALAESLPLRGHLVVQGFADGDQISLLECNPRVGGASTLGFAAGVDSLRWALREARGETVEPRRGGYRRGLRLVRHPADRLIEA